MISSDVQSIRDGYAAFAAGDLETIAGLFTPDAVWHVPGHSAMAGDYVGPEQIIGYFVQLFTESGGTFRADLIECGELAPGLVCALVECSGTMAAGSLRQQLVQVFARRDGKTCEAWTYFQDLYAVDAVMPARTSITLPDARTAETAIPTA